VLVLRVREYPFRRFRVLQLLIDRDERLDRLRGRGEELALLVAERLGVRLAALRERAQPPPVDRQRHVCNLHELGEVEQRLQDLGGHRRGVEGRLE